MPSLGLDVKKQARSRWGRCSNHAAHAAKGLSSAVGLYTEGAGTLRADTPPTGRGVGMVEDDHPCRRGSGQCHQCRPSRMHTSDAHRFFVRLPIEFVGRDRFEKLGRGGRFLRQLGEEVWAMDMIISSSKGAWVGRHARAHDFGSIVELSIKQTRWDRRVVWNHFFFFS